MAHGVKSEVEGSKSPKVEKYYHESTKLRNHESNVENLKSKSLRVKKTKEEIFATDTHGQS